jgi:hypothetical protein
MSQKKNKKRLKIYEQGSPGSTGFSETKVKQNKLYEKEYRQNQKLIYLPLFNTERSPCDFGPKTNGKCGYAETKSRCREWS